MMCSCHNKQMWLDRVGKEILPVCYSRSGNKMHNLNKLPIKTLGDKR